MQSTEQDKTAISSLRVGGWLLIVAGVLVGCSGRPEVTYSGFLRDYSLLKPHPKVEGAMLYQNPAKDPKEYSRFLIDPIIAHFSPEEEGAAINPDDLKELTDYFRGQLVKGLTESGRYQVVDAPGPGVLRVRIAITAIEKTVPLANIHPGTKLSGMGLGGAALELEAVDAVSGERVAALVDAQSGGRLGVTAGLQTYGHAKQVMDQWVERFVKRLDEAHGYSK